jgi:hypothetical protein
MGGVCVDTYTCGPAVGNGNYENKNEEPPGLGILQRLNKLALVPFCGLRCVLELLGAKRCEFSLGWGEE